MRFPRVLTFFLASVALLLGSLAGSGVANASAPARTASLSIGARIDNTGVATVTVRWSNFPASSFNQIAVAIVGVPEQYWFSTDTGAKGSETVYFQASLQQTPKGDVTFTTWSYAPDLTEASVTKTTSYTGWSTYTPPPK